MASRLLPPPSLRQRVLKRENISLSPLIGNPYCAHRVRYGPSSGAVPLAGPFYDAVPASWLQWDSVAKDWGTAKDCRCGVVIGKAMGTSTRRVIAVGAKVILPGSGESLRL